MQCNSFPKSQTRQSHKHLETSGPITLDYTAATRQSCFQAYKAALWPPENVFHRYISTGCHHTGHNEIKQPCSTLENNVVVSEVKTVSRQVWACSLALRTAGWIFLHKSGGGCGDHCASSERRVASLCTFRVNSSASLILNFLIQKRKG